MALKNLAKPFMRLVSRAREDWLCVEVWLDDAPYRREAPGTYYDSAGHLVVSAERIDRLETVWREAPTRKWIELGYF